MTIGRHNSTCSTWSRRDDPGRSPGQRVALARPGRAACGGTAISAGNELLLYHTSDWLPHAYIASAAMSIGAAWLYSKARQRPDCSAASCWHCFWVSWLASRFRPHRCGMARLRAAGFLLRRHRLPHRPLRVRMDTEDRRLRSAILQTLGRANYQAAAADRDNIDEFLWQELGDSAWVMVAIVDIGVDAEGAVEPLHRALEYRLAQIRRRCLQLLSLVGDGSTIQRAGEQLHRHLPEQRSTLWRCWTRFCRGMPIDS